MYRMVAAMAIFGSVGFAAGRTGLQSFELVFVRCICAVPILGAGWLLSGQFRRESWALREMLLVLMSGVCLVGNWVFLFRAFETVPVTVTISVYYLAPVFVLLLGSLLFREPLRMSSAVSVIVCTAGTALVSGIGSGPQQGLLSAGLLWALLAALLYALVTLLGKGIRRMSPYAVAMLQTSVGVLLLPPFVHFSAFHGLGTGQWLWIALLGTVHTGLVYYLFFGSLRHLPARTISIFAFLDPGIAMLLDILITGFRPSLLQVLGILLIFGGMTAPLWKGNEREGRQSAGTQ
ncbi:DMT family transporter [Paenibacillus sp. S-38]|uniref:DMT family transporter n=1 Tax=Paenibacillus sp. S-38 TaxID=3416710 RepID=UPI003CEF773E